MISYALKMYKFSIVVTLVLRVSLFFFQPLKILHRVWSPCGGCGWPRGAARLVDSGRATTPGRGAGASLGHCSVPVGCTGLAGTSHGARGWDGPVTGRPGDRGRLVSGVWRSNVSSPQTAVPPWPPESPLGCLSLRCGSRSHEPRRPHKARLCRSVGAGHPVIRLLTFWQPPADCILLR